MNDNQDQEIKRLLSEEAERRDTINESLLLEIYELEVDKSTMDRRHGLPDGIRRIIEKNTDKHESY